MSWIRVQPPRTKVFHFWMVVCSAFGNVHISLGLKSSVAHGNSLNFCDGNCFVFCSDWCDCDNSLLVGFRVDENFAAFLSAYCCGGRIFASVYLSVGENLVFVLARVVCCCVIEYLDSGCFLVAGVRVIVRST